MSDFGNVDYEPAGGDGVQLFDPTAECAALAAFITRPASRKQMAAELGLQHFHQAAHRKIWPVIIDLHQRRQTIDGDILQREIERREISVTPGVLDGIVRTPVTDVTLDVEQLIKLSRHRWALQKSAELRDAAHNLDADIIDELAGHARELANAVRRSRRRHDAAAGVEQLRERMEKMIAGKIRNIAWPDAPMLTTIARALESCSIAMVGGMPGDGKTFLILQSLIGWAQTNVRTAVCMLEKNRAWHLNRCLAVIEQNANLLHAEWCERNPTLVRDAIDRHHATLLSLSASVYESESVGNTLQEIGQWIDSQLDEVDVVVVDPISLADAGEKRWIADNNFIDQCIRSVARTDGRVVLVTHPKATTSSQQGLATQMGGLVYQRATDAVLHIAKHDKPKHYDVIRMLLGHRDRVRVTANRTISVHKGRNATQGGAKFAFHFGRELRYVEQGVIQKESKEEQDDGNDDRSEAEAEADAAIAAIESRMEPVEEKLFSEVK